MRFASLLLPLIILLAAIGVVPSPAAAQTLRVVATCGTVSPSYVAGQFNYPTVDVNGNACGVSLSGSIVVSNFPTTSGTPCATATTAGCTGPDTTALLAQIAAGAINCQALSAEQTKATTGNPIATTCDLVGKLVTSPYANRENMARGFATETGTSAGTILAASGSASLKEYLTGIECYNTSATTDTVTLNDSASTKLINPAGGGNNQTYAVPLVVAANTAATFTPTAGQTTEACSAQGFYGY